MAAYPPLLDFVIDVNEDVPMDYWNYYSFDSQVTNCIDFNYRKILKNEGFLTEILMKEKESVFYESSTFLSVTKERSPYFQKIKNRKILKRINIEKLFKKKPIKTKTPIKKTYHTIVNRKFIKPTSKYVRKETQINGNQKKHQVHKVIIKVEDSDLQTDKFLIKDNNIHNSFNHNPNANNPNLTFLNSYSNYTNNLPLQLRVPLTKPSYDNFICFLKSSFTNTTLNYLEDGVEPFYLLKTLIDTHFEPERKSAYEKATSIIRALPPTPQEPHLLPVLNHSLEIDYNLLHIKIESDLSYLRESGKEPKRKVAFQEEKSLDSLSKHFKIPKVDLEQLFNGVSRYFPDLMEVFKGNCKMLWSQEEDNLLKLGDTPNTKDRRRTFRRIRFLSLIDSSFLK